MGREINDSGDKVVEIEELEVAELRVASLAD
jgi:hypothetical protein